MKVSALLQDSHSAKHYWALGGTESGDRVCAAITPWNFPAAMITRKAAPALVAAAADNRGIPHRQLAVCLYFREHGLERAEDPE